MMFFGKPSTLYNVTLAQVLLYQASYPVLGNPVPYAHHQLSRTFFIQGNLDEALSEARKELTIYPNDTATYYVLGLTLGFMNREKEAIEAFSEFIKYNPGTWSAANDKAWLQFRIGDIQGAVMTIKPMADRATDNAWIQNTYCTLMINVKDYISAKKACMLAKKAAEKMTEKDWGRAYPGNDPRIYGTGLNAMRMSIDENLKLLDEKEKEVEKLGR